MLAKASAGGAEITAPPARTPQPQCRGHAPSAAAPVPTVRAQPAAGGGQVSVNAKGLHECAASGISHKIKRWRQTQTAHAADEYRQRHQPTSTSRTAAFAHGNAQSSSDASTRQQPGPQAPVQVFHTPLGPRGQNTTANTQTSAAAGPACRQAASASSSRLRKTGLQFTVYSQVSRVSPLGLYQTNARLSSPNATPAGRIGGCRPGNPRR